MNKYDEGYLRFIESEKLKDLLMEEEDIGSEWELLQRHPEIA